MKVKSHVGITGNKVADKLANQAMMNVSQNSLEEWRMTGVCSEPAETVVTGYMQCQQVPVRLYLHIALG